MRSIDKTHLSIDTAEERGFIHRDYIAHCLRWSFVVKKMYEKKNWTKAHVLDIGCGKEAPLAKLLYSSRLSPVSYTGVDVNKLDKFTESHIYEKMANKFTIRLLGECDFGDVNLIQGTDPHFTHITCFEVLEHVTPAHAVRILKNIRYHLRKTPDRGHAFISTPCWDPRVGAAANHINEMRYKTLEALLEILGFRIIQRYGTFASQRDIVPALSDDELQTFRALSKYYDSNYLSTVLAPLYPEHSRNCLWYLSAREGDSCRDPNNLYEQETPLSSSPYWEDFYHAIYE